MPPKRRAAAARAAASKTRSKAAKQTPRRQATTTKATKKASTKAKKPQAVRKRPRSSSSQRARPAPRARGEAKETAKSPAVRETRSEDSPAQLTASRASRQSIHVWQQQQRRLSESNTRTAAHTQNMKESEAAHVAKQLFASHSPTREQDKSSSSETVFIAERSNEAVMASGVQYKKNNTTEADCRQAAEGQEDIELVLHSLTSSSSSSSSLDTAELFSLSSAEPNSRRTTIGRSTHNNASTTSTTMMTSFVTAQSSSTQAAHSAPSLQSTQPLLSEHSLPIHDSHANTVYTAGSHSTTTSTNTTTTTASHNTVQTNQDILRAHFLQTSPMHLRLDGSGRKEPAAQTDTKQSHTGTHGVYSHPFPSQPQLQGLLRSPAQDSQQQQQQQNNNTTTNTMESSASHRTCSTRAESLSLAAAGAGHTLASGGSASRPSTQLITRAAAMKPLVSPGTMWICLDDDDEDAAEPTSPSSPTLRNVLLTPATEPNKDRTNSAGNMREAYMSYTQPVRPYYYYYNHQHPPAAAPPPSLPSAMRLSTEPQVQQAHVQQQQRSVSQELRQSKEPIGRMLWPTFRPRRAAPASLAATQAAQGDRARVAAASTLRLPEHGYIRMDDDDDNDEEEKDNVKSKKRAQGSNGVSKAAQQVAATPQLLPFIKDDDHTDSSSSSSSEEDDEEMTASSATASPHHHHSSSGSNFRTQTHSTTHTTPSSSFTAAASSASSSPSHSVSHKTHTQDETSRGAVALSSPNRSVIDFLFSARPAHIASSEAVTSKNASETSEAKRAGAMTNAKEEAGGKLGWGRPVDDLLRLFPRRYTRANFRAAAADVIPSAHFLAAGEFWSAFASAAYVGEGSFGLVWRCVTVAGDAVAVKSCPVSLRSRGSIEDGFATVREIATMRFLSEMQVPYVLPLHSAFYVAGREALPPQIVRVLDWRRRRRAVAEAAVVERRVKELSRGGRLARRARNAPSAAAGRKTRGKQQQPPPRVRPQGKACSGGRGSDAEKDDESDFERAVQEELKRMEAGETAEERAVRAEMQAVQLPRFFSIREDEVEACDVTIFLVTELCDGDVESIPRNDAVTKGVAYCVSSALAGMHELGLLHLDLKPSNILFAYERNNNNHHHNQHDGNGMSTAEPHRGNNSDHTGAGHDECGSYESPPLDITTLSSVTPPMERTPPTVRLSSGELGVCGEREETGSAAQRASHVLVNGAAQGHGLLKEEEARQNAVRSDDEQHTRQVDQLSPCRDVNEETGKRASGGALSALPVVASTCEASKKELQTAALTTPSQPRAQRETIATTTTGVPVPPSSLSSAAAVNPAIKFYLSDFGNCRVVGPQQSDTVKDVYGTFEYMDLRALRDEVCSRATDSFSLGCTLYEMLYGRRVYPHCTNPKCVHEEDHTRLCFVEAAKRPVVLPVTLSTTTSSTEQNTRPSAACETRSENEAGKIPLTTLQKVTAALLLHDPQQRMTAAQCHAHLAKAYHVTQALRHHTP